ncbi:type 2 periplasmic-binding domain-containing protein [Ideonella paludis]
MNYTHQQMQAALAGQGVALARLAMVHEAVENGDLIEPFGAQGRRWAPWCYWLLPLGGAGAQPRPEVLAFSAWVQQQAALTRQAIGDTPDPEAEIDSD